MERFTHSLVPVPECYMARILNLTNGMQLMGTSSQRMLLSKEVSEG